MPPGLAGEVVQKIAARSIGASAIRAGRGGSGAVAKGEKSLSSKNGLPVLTGEVDQAEAVR